MIIRREHKRNFTTLANEVVDDERLSYEALGLLTYLLSRPDDWEVRIDQLRARTKIGRDKIYRIVGELQNAGYLKHERIYEEGKVKLGRYIVLEAPCGEQFAPEIGTEALHPEKPDEGVELDPENLHPENLPPEKPDEYQRLTGTKDSQAPTERERAREAEEHPTPMEALDLLRPIWPDFALENRELVLSALSTRKASERQLLLDRVPDFLAFHREKRGKARLPFLHNYVAQENRWQDLPERAKPEPSEDAGRVPAFSRTWWWVWARAAERGLTQGEHRHVSGAIKFGGNWYVDPAKRADFDAAAERELTKHPRDGDLARAWRSYYRSLGIDMPIPDKVEWVFLPPTRPPDSQPQPGLSQADRDFVTEGVD